MIVIAERSDVVPKSVVVTRTVASPEPAVTPAGRVVVNDARPSPAVIASFVIGGIPGTVRLKVTWAPASGFPSGSVTRTRSWIGAGRPAAEIRYDDALRFALSFPEPCRTDSTVSEVF